MRSKLVLLSSYIPIILVINACSSAEVNTNFIGYVEADWVYIAAPSSGWLTSQPVKNGQQVSVGDLLFELDKDEQILALSEAQARENQAAAQARNIAVGARPAEIRVLEAKVDEANVRLLHAASELKRISPLVENGIETRNRGEEVEANYKTASANLTAAKESLEVAKLAGRDALRDAAKASQQSAEAIRLIAQWRLQQREIKSGVSGHVEEIFHHLGEFVTAGLPVVAILPDTGMKVRFFVPQAKLPKLRLGLTVKIYSDGLPDALDASISHIAISPEYSPPVIYSQEAREKLVFLIEATLPPSSPVHPGLPVEVAGL